MAGDGTVFQRKKGHKCYLIYNTGKKIINSKGNEVYEQIPIDLKTRDYKQAVENAKIVRADLAKNGYQKQTEETLEKLVLDWLKDCETRVSPRTKKRLGKRTIEEYEKIINNHILKSEIKDCKAKEVTPKQIRELIGKIMNESDFTARKVYTILNSAYKLAFMDDELEKNPCAKVTAPRQPKIRHKIWTADQSLAFLEESEKTQPLFKYGIFLMSLHQGLRIGEVLGLPISNVKLDESTALISQKLTRIKGEWVIEEILKTDKTHRIIVLTPTVVKTLREIIGNRREGLVFTAQEGGVVRLENLRNRGFNSLIRMYNKKIDSDEKIKPEDKEAKKIPKIRIHDMRHSAGTLLYKLFKDIKLVQLYLGHATISMAADVYVHEDLDMLREAASAMDTALTGRKIQEETKSCST
jgi:integrase